MPIPSTSEIKRPLLERLQQVNQARISDLYEFLSNHFQLTPEELTQLYESGSDYVFKNRIRWARQHLISEGLAISPGHGLLAITQEGTTFLNNRAQIPAIGNEEIEAQINPEEAIENNFTLIQSSLKDELLTTVKQQTWQFFEKLVIDLLLKMGYGSSRKEAGIAFQAGNDEGIDGIINEDPLGLDIIYVQAKKWENNVGRRDIQGFLGALSTKRATKGVFITTSSFNNNAIECAKESDKKVVLIDGNKLSNLMIEYKLAVSVFKTYEIKRVDNDYFSID
jgi:restriction system protein